MVRHMQDRKVWKTYRIWLKTKSRLCMIVSLYNLKEYLLMKNYWKTLGIQLLIKLIKKTNSQHQLKSTIALSNPTEAKLSLQRSSKLAYLQK